MEPLIAVVPLMASLTSAILNASLLSTSVSFAKTSITTSVSSLVVAVSSLATGALFVRGITSVKKSPSLKLTPLNETMLPLTVAPVTSVASLKSPSESVKRTKSPLVSMSAKAVKSKLISTVPTSSNVS